MSKVGKKPIVIPEKVTVSVADSSVTVKGPKGELTKPLPRGVNVVVENNEVRVSPVDRSKANVAKWGLVRALIANMIKGVTEGFEKVLEFQGVGYKAVVKGTGLEMGLGYSHPITIEGVPGITFSVEKNTIKISGINNELIGEVAARIRKLRLPEPYKGSGIRYAGEVIRRKAGKKATA